MLEIISGTIIGAIFSIVIAEAYHRRASKETQVEINNLKKIGSELEEYLKEIKSSSFYTAEMTEILKKHATHGTPDDPNYPYK